jgi:mono/diheme cytochrome c family protein
MNRSLTFAVLVSLIVGCRGEGGEDPPLLPIRNMYDQERYNPEAYSNYFGDHRTMRTPVEGTLSQERYELTKNVEVATGRLEDGSGYVLTIPPAVGPLDKLLERGQERFRIYCSPCHDNTGSGKGMVAMVQPGFPQLPSFYEGDHGKRIRAMPDGQLFVTITNGRGNMPSYAAQIPINDRWAIVAYVRALQLSMVSRMENKK